MTKEKYDIKAHFGTCDSCGQRNVLIVHYNYSTQPNNDFRLCPKCIGKGLIVLCNPVLFLSEGVDEK